MATLSTTTQPASTSSLKQVIIRHPLLAYFVLAFAGTWGVQLPMLLSRDGFGLLPYTVPMVPFILLFVLSTYAGPTLAALVVTATESGRAGVRAFLRRYVHWRVGLRWYLLVLAGYPLVYLAATTPWLGATPFRALITHWPVIFTTYLSGVLVFPALITWGEEPGWRGFALPRLEARFGPVPGSLLLGLLHGLWHLPVFVYSGGPIALGPFDLSTFALNTALIAMMTIIWTWVYNNTGGSILLAVLLHASLNASQAFIGKLIPAYPDAATLLVNVAFVVIALLLVIATRGRLSYRGAPAPDTAATPDTGATAPGQPAA